MKIPKYVVDTITIRRVFPPAKQTIGWNTLYAEFDDSSTVDLINQYLTNLLPGRKVDIYVPNGLFPRYRTIRDIEHSYRKGEVQHKTKIKYGISDFVLIVKPKDSNFPWTYISLNSLPPLQLSQYDGNPSSSPPPGRSRIPSKRARPESPESVITRSNKTKLDTNLSDSLDAGIELTIGAKVTPPPPTDDFPTEELTRVDEPNSVLPEAVEPSEDLHKTPTKVNPHPNTTSDLGAFRPSACVSPSRVSGKSFTFSTKEVSGGSSTSPHLNY